MAPTPATAAGTAEPTARNFDATATPHDSPSADLATIEKVMAGTISSPPRDTRLPSTALRVGQSNGAAPAGLPVCRPPSTVRDRDRDRCGRQRRVHAGLDAVLPRRHRPDARAGGRRHLAGQPGRAAERPGARLD